MLQQTCKSHVLLFSHMFLLTSKGQKMLFHHEMNNNCTTNFDRSTTRTFPKHKVIKKNKKWGTQIAELRGAAKQDST